MQVLIKGMRALQLYLPNNPIYQKARDNIKGGFEPVWEECSELELRINESDFIWDDAVVLSQPSRSDSVAWVLYKDGVRSITLSPGVEDEEIVRFLDMIHKARNLPAEASDDLLTLLWEQDFQFVRYDSIELGEDDVAPLEPSASSWSTSPPTEETVREQLQEDVEEGEEGEAEEPASRESGIVRMEDFDSTLYFLDDDELKYLKNEIDREYKQDLRGNVLAMLFDLLELQTFSTVRAELISIVDNFVPYLLGVGDFRSVSYLLAEIRVVLERARELVPEQRQELLDLPGKLSQPDALNQLLQSLDEAVVHPTEDELGGLFTELRPEAIEGVLEWMPRLENERVRGLLEHAVRRLAQAHPDQVIKTLESGEDVVLLETVRLVSNMKLPPFVPSLGKLLTHDDVEVRRAATEALSAIGSPGAMKELERAIDDGDRDVRIAAVRVMAERGHRNALSKIEQAVKGKALRQADLTERQAFFEAYGVLAGPAGIESLRQMLVGKGLLRRKEDPETRACAAMALGKIGTPEAHSALQALGGEKDPLVKNAINRALREVG